MDAVLPLASPATKTRAALLSLAICDALGGPAEFRARGTFPRISSFLPNAHFSLAPGTWTDDTSMALCLASSLVSGDGGGFSEASQAREYLKWYMHGHLSATDTCFDIGATVRQALEIWREHGTRGGGTGREGDEEGEGDEGDEGEVVYDADAALAKVRQRLDRPTRCGNGSLMRVLPVALAHWKTPARALSYARRSSLVTHPHALCQEACAVYVHLVTTILAQASSSSPSSSSSAAAAATSPQVSSSFTKRNLLSALNDYPYETRELRSALGKGSDVPGRSEAQIRSSGYVLHTLEAALWAFFTTRSFDEGALRAANLGDDADTVAAVYGGLAGAWYADGGFWRGTVGEWRQGLVRREVVEAAADGLVKLGEGVEV